MRFSKILFLLGIIASVNLNAQTKLSKGLYNRLVEIAEQSTESDESNVDFNTFLENLEYYALHPINLNSASKEDFIDLALMTEFEIQKILDYRDLLKGFVEVDELILAGIDKQKVKDLSMFLTVGSIDSYQMNHPKEVFSNLDHQLFLRTYRVLETQKGYTGNTPSFEGNPYKYYARYSANYYRNLQFGFVLEKDEGESFYQKSNAFSYTKPLAGFDYRNGYLSFKTNSIVKQVIVGAYSLQLGQGLMSWSGMALGKSVYTLQSKRIGTLLRPYSSVNENLFYKGIATHIQFKKWMLLPYVSIKKRDGNMIFQDTTSVSDAIGSLQMTGFHRTEGEIEDESSVKETIFGLSVGRHWQKLELKLNAQQTHYDKKLEKGSQAYQLHDFSGNRLETASLDFKYLGKKHTVFGESAIQSRQKKATLIGTIIHLHSKLDLIALYRNYAPGFYASYSNSFGESRGTSNEKGVYMGFEIRPKKSWTVNAYIDNYIKPWLTYTTFAPSSGTDFLIQISQRKNDYFDHYLRVKYEINQQNGLGNPEIKSPVNQINARLRYHLNYSPLKWVALRSRLELSQNESDGKSELGTLLYQDIKFSCFRYRLDINSRIAMFNTPSFNTAIYAYESDVLYSFSVPAYYSKGTRYYLMTSYDLTRNLKLWLRFSRWIYTDAKKVSSSYTEIKGDTKSDIRVQLRYLF